MIKPPVTPAMVLKFANRKDVVGAVVSLANDRALAGDRPQRTVRVLFLRRSPPRARRPAVRGSSRSSVPIPTLPSGDLEPGFNRKSKSAKLELTDELRDTLVRHFADEIRTCADTLGGPAVAWRQKYNL